MERSFLNGIVIYIVKGGKMEQATEKQISFARSLGIDNPESYSKQALKEVIDLKLNNGKPTPKKQYQPQQAVQQTLNNPVGALNSGQIEHHVLINRVEKPHSFEFGKAGQRHKVYYSDILELKQRIKELTEAGFVDTSDIVLLDNDNSE